MTTPELPPMPGTALISPNGKPERVMSADMVERAVEARERILMARIAELEADAERLLEPLRAFVGCAYTVSTEIEPRGHNWCEAWLDEALPIAREAINAARGAK